MKLFCNHKWEVVLEKVTESKFEVAVRAIKSGRVTAANVTIPAQMSCAERKVIIIVACSKCGLIKKMMEKV